MRTRVKCRPTRVGPLQRRKTVRVKPYSRSRPRPIRRRC